MIAIDLDGVVANTEPVLRKALINFTKEKFTPPQPRTYDFRDGFSNLSLQDCLDVIDNALIDAGNSIPVINFDRTYFALAKIQKEYNKVYFVSARSYITRKVTEEWLRCHFGRLNYELHLVDHAEGSKERWMKDYGIDILVEDRLKTANGINDKQRYQVFLVNQEWNMQRPIEPNVTRVTDLLDVLSFL